LPEFDRILHVKADNEETLMKIRLLFLPLIFVTHVAMAGNPAPQPGQQVQAGAIHHPVRHKLAVHHRKHHVRRLPHGDLRACLAHKDNKAVIRCAERRHGRRK
jgi:hypothetical protein